MSELDIALLVFALLGCGWAGYLIGKEQGDGESTKAWHHAEYWKSEYDKVTKEK